MTLPMDVSQLAPPMTVTTSGLRALSRRAIAKELAFCENIVVKPTRSL